MSTETSRLTFIDILCNPFGTSFHALNDSFRCHVVFNFDRPENVCFVKVWIGYCVQRKLSVSI